MTRLRTDQACLEAQMQQQIAQNLNAELAVPCPDCGVESGRACRGDFNREVRTHLARSVAANRRDTEPCPPPPSILVDRYALADGDYDGMSLESLERASARAFAESVERSREEERRIGARIAEVWTRVAKQVEQEVSTEAPRIKWLETAQTGGDFFAIDQTPTAPDCAPGPVVPPTAFPVEHCTGCSKEMRSGVKMFRRGIANPFNDPFCGDCAAALDRDTKPAPLDKRVAEAKSDDVTECAWSTPTSDGEGWT